MRVAFVVAIAFPALGAALLATSTDVKQIVQRGIHLISILTAAFALGTLGWRVWSEGSVEEASFRADTWAVLLAAGVLLAAAAYRAPSPFQQICHLSAAAAAVGSVLCTDVVATSAFLFLTTIALAVGAAVGRNGSSIIAIGLSDLLAVSGLVWAAGAGMRSPPSPSLGPALLLLAAGVIRILADRDASRGLVRLQGIFLCVWALATPPDPAPSIVLLAGVAAALFARKAWFGADAHAALAADGLIVVALLAEGTVQARWSAALLVAGTVVAATRRFPGSIIGLAATLPGLAMAATAMAATTAGRPDDLLEMISAVAVVIAAAWLVLARVTVSRRDERSIADVLPALAAAALVIVPGTAFRELGARIGPSLGAGPPLGDLQAALPDAAGIAFVVAVIGVILVARGRGTDTPTVLPAPLTSGRIALPRWAPALVVIEAAAIGWFLALLVLGIRRGFL